MPRRVRPDPAAMRPLRARPARLVLVAVAVVLAACGDSGPAAPPPISEGIAADTVFMPGNSFSPFSLTIKAGQSVAWEFPAEAHNVIFPKGAANQPLVPGSPADILPTTNRVVTRRFTAAGTFPYDCTLHAGMQGEVVVER